VLTNAMDAARKLMKAEKLLVELLPGPLFLFLISKYLVDSYISLFATSFFHLCGTCKMETLSNQEECSKVDGACRNHQENSAVVDAELRVLYTRKLRIADASVFPCIPSGPTSAIAMVVGQVCAKKLLE
jgi:choline dehydrogenase-like flavoprotein